MQATSSDKILDCKNLIDLAKEFKLLIVCDDVYNLLWYEGDGCPKRLLQWDKEGSNIISNGTFSKVLAPGVRVGQYFLNHAFRIYIFKAD